MAEIEEEKLATKYKWLIGGAAAFLIAPVIFMVVKGIVGLVIAGAVGFTVTQLAPVFALKMANWKLRLIRDEVEANPIETLQNLLVEKTNLLTSVDTQITEFDTEIRNFKDQLKSFAEQYPDEAVDYEELHSTMKDALQDMKSEQAAARGELANLEQQIAKAEAILKMSLAAQKVTKLSKAAESQVYADIKKKIAFDKVRSQLNKTFASLDRSLDRRREVTMKLPEPKNVESIPLKIEDKQGVIK
jgi:chromosome segregation ATPase